VKVSLNLSFLTGSSHRFLSGSMKPPFPLENGFKKIFVQNQNEDHGYYETYDQRGDQSLFVSGSHLAEGLEVFLFVV